MNVKSQAFRSWKRTLVVTESGETSESVAPVIVSASRATDIPAFYASWFMNRLRAGFVCRTNPFNPKQVEHISFGNTRAVVFWSKDPRPLFPYLPEIDANGIAYYFQFTLNDYRREGLEPHLSTLQERVDAFRNLADMIGPKRVVWRCDPLVLNETVTIEALLERIDRLAAMLRGYTEKLVFSFVDIERYPKVRSRLARQGSAAREFGQEEMTAFATGLSLLNRGWGLTLATCAEEVDFNGIGHSRCVDGPLLADLFRDDAALTEFLGMGADLFGSPPDWARIRDRGQRKACGCVASKDIGVYGTCPQLCSYCYANGFDQDVREKAARHDPLADRLIP